MGNLESCREAANYYEKTIASPFEFDSPIEPKGCFLKADIVYWNTNETGERNDVSKEICVGTG